MRTDTLQRRLRTATPNPEGRPVGAPQRLCLTEADFLVFEALDRHGPLPIHYLFEFQKALRPSYRHFQYRLRDLFHGDKEGNYLARPPAQFTAYEARYQPLVYDLSPRARLWLANLGRLSPYWARRYDPFIHQLMTACVTSSIELLAPKFNIRFISKDEIFTRTTCPKETQERSNPLAIRTGARMIIADSLFGLEYKDQGFRFFALEADRNNESIRSRRGNAPTFERKIEAYRMVLRGRIYERQWGLPNLSVLTVTTNAGHASNLVNHLHQLLGGEKDDRFLFQCETAFGANWRVPKTLLCDLLQKPWDHVSGSKAINKR